MGHPVCVPLLHVDANVGMSIGTNVADKLYVYLSLFCRKENLIRFDQSNRRRHQLRSSNDDVISLDDVSRTVITEE